MYVCIYYIIYAYACNNAYMSEGIYIYVNLHMHNGERFNLIYA